MKNVRARGTQTLLCVNRFCSRVRASASPLMCSSSTASRSRWVTERNLSALREAQTPIFNSILLLLVFLFNLLDDVSLVEASRCLPVFRPIIRLCASSFLIRGARALLFQPTELQHELLMLQLALLASFRFPPARDGVRAEMVWILL